MPDDPRALRQQAAEIRRDMEKLQGFVDALGRKALDLEERARLASAIPSVTRKEMIIVDAPPLGPETLRDARRSADVEGVERQALADGTAQAKQAQSQRYRGGRQKVGDETRAMVITVWPEEAERLRAQYRGKTEVPKKTIDAAVARRVGKSVRTVQRYTAGIDAGPT